MNPQIPELLNQLIQLAELQADELKNLNLAAHRAVRTVGENTVVFHLKALKELIDKEIPNQKNTVTLGGKDYEISTGVNTNVPFSSFFVSTLIPQRVGCIGNRWCYRCKIQYYSSCMCLSTKCPRCGSDRPDKAPESLEGWFECHDAGESSKGPLTRIFRNGKWTDYHPPIVGGDTTHELTELVPLDGGGEILTRPHELLDGAYDRKDGDRAERLPFVAP